MYDRNNISLNIFLAFYYKKYREFKANRNIVEEIHIGLQDQNNNEMFPNGQIIKRKPFFNTQKYNSPLFNWSQIRIFFLIQFTGLTFYFFIVFNFKIDQQHLIIPELICQYYVGILIPLYIVLRKKAIRAHFCMLISDGLR